MKITGVALLIAVVTSFLFVVACVGGQDGGAPAVTVTEIAPTDTPTPTNTLEPTSTLNSVSTRSSTPPPISMVLEAVSPELLRCVRKALGDEQFDAIISGRQDAVAQQLGIVLPCIMQYPEESNALMGMFGLDLGTIMSANSPTPDATSQPKPYIQVPTATPPLAPTATPVPAVTSVPTSTPLPVPTATPYPTPTLTPAPTATPEPVTIASEITGFTLESFTIEIGSTVKWIQSSTAPHSVTSGTTDDYYSYPDGKWDSGTLKNGESFSVGFDEVGVFRYFCNIHPGSMTGVITVVKN